MESRMGPAKALCLTCPQALLATPDEVIEWSVFSRAAYVALWPLTDILLAVSNVRFQV
jgi:hypothetical protein